MGTLRELSYIFTLLAALCLIYTYSNMLSGKQRVVILGGGIHGCSVAYYLALKGIPSTIVEETGIAAAASGKSGGFLARDWGSAQTTPLHEISYNLHEVLSKELKLESYRIIPTLSVRPGQKGKNAASWLDRSASSQSLGEGTAQVSPSELTQRFFDEACKLGCQFLKGKVKGVNVVDNEVTGVSIEGRDVIETSNVVVCLGPWSGVFCEDNFGIRMPMEGIKSTSMVYRNMKDIMDEPFALFCEEDDNGCHLELYPRPNGDLYVCGCGGSDYVKGDRLREGGDCASAQLINEDPNRVLAARKSVQLMSSIGDKDPDILQACMRPCPSDGLPIMGQINSVKGAYVSTGHNCWGILWAPVSGLAMAELIAEGTSKIVNLSPFSPNRFQIKKDSRGRKVKDVSVGEQW